MARALLLESPHESADEVFARVGIDVVRAPGALQGAELVDALRGVDILGIRSKTSLTREVLEASAHLTAIGAYCIGTNQIDLATASRLGIAVFNAPYANTRSVVELAIAEAIALTRRLPEKNAALQAGVWAKSAEGAHEVRGKTLGIVGYGSIGTQLSVLAEALGMHVIFHDVAERLAIGNAARVRSLSQLLAASDIVSIHVDGRPSNKGFFGKDRIAEMKRGAILINLSRGSVVDVDALRERLADSPPPAPGRDVDVRHRTFGLVHEIHHQLGKTDGPVLDPGQPASHPVLGKGGMRSFQVDLRAVPGSLGAERLDAVVGVHATVGSPFLARVPGKSEFADLETSHCLTLTSGLGNASDNFDP